MSLYEILEEIRKDKEFDYSPYMTSEELSDETNYMPEDCPDRLLIEWLLDENRNV